MTDRAALEKETSAMSDHYETRCPSCGGSDEQGCYADCPTTVITALRAEVARLRAALGGIKWQSVDRDNMEFSAKITCYQLDMIHAVLEDGP